MAGSATKGIINSRSTTAAVTEITKPVNAPPGFDVQDGQGEAVAEAQPVALSDAQLIALVNSAAAAASEQGWPLVVVPSRLDGSALRKLSLDYGVCVDFVERRELRCAGRLDIRRRLRGREIQQRVRKLQRASRSQWC